MDYKNYKNNLFLQYKMILGKYSVSHYMALRERCKKGEEERMNEEMAWFMVNFLIWILALCALIYAWNYMDMTAQVIGVIGLLFGSYGAIITLAVILFSQSQRVQQLDLLSSSKVGL